MTHSEVLAKSVLDAKIEHVMTQCFIFNFILLNLPILLNSRFTKHPKCNLNGPLCFSPMFLSLYCLQGNVFSPWQSIHICVAVTINSHL